MRDDAAAVFAAARMIVKVKEVLPPEYGLLDAGLVASAAEETHALGSPNSVLAGEVGALEGIRLCLAPHGGSGRHFTPRFGAPSLPALVVGLGEVGRGALRTLLRLGVSVVGLDVDRGARYRAELDWSTADFAADLVDTPARRLPDADLVAGAVRWPKQRDDHLIDRSGLATMKPTAVIVDIACDAAGAVETTRPTNWTEPVYVVDGIRYFCIDNIPGAVPVVASAGYGEAILPLVKLVADRGALEACRADPWLRRGLTCAGGVLILEETGRVQNRDYTPAEAILAAAP